MMNQFQYTSVLITHDNREVIAGTEDGLILIWDIETGQLKHRVEHHKQVVFGLDLSPDGQLIASSSTEENIKIWNHATKKIVASIPHKAQVALEVFFADDETIYAGLMDERFEMWDVRSGQSIFRFVLKEDEGQLRTLHLAPDRKMLALGYEWGLLEVWNIKTSTLLYTHKHQVYMMNQVRFSPDGRYLLITADFHLSVRDSQTGVLLKELTDLVCDHGIFSNDARYVLAVVHDPKDEIHVALWDWQTSSPARTFGGHRGTIDAVAISQDGSLFVSADYDGRIIVRDTATGHIVSQFDIN